MATIDWQSRVERISQRLERLAQITDEPGRLTRTLLSPAMSQATLLASCWMEEAGMQTSTDFIGNLIGRTSGMSEKRVFLIGSHLDTVRDAGRFDGALGVVLGIELADIFRSRSPLPFALMAAAFSDEEGVRFQTAYLGSRAFCGLLGQEDLEVSNREGSLRQLLAGGQTAVDLPPSAVSRDQLAGYFEVHIEQGPVLEDRNLPVGVVTAIAGQSRFRFNWAGKAAHAGTTPIGLRKDALLGAARFALQAETACTRFPGLVATVGELTVSPNVSNVVPAQITHSLDVRHQDDAVRAAAVAWLCQEADQIATDRKLILERLIVQETASVACDPNLTARLAAATQFVTGTILELPSGAGHDAVILSQLCPVAMLFVRCRDGLSHHPDEFVQRKDIEIALRTAVRFIETLGGAEGEGLRGER
jgi:allantoate deiminase